MVQKSDDPLLQTHDSWERVRLGDIARILNGSAFESKYFNSKGEGMPLIRIRDVGRSNTETFYTGQYEEKYIVEEGDLLIGMDGDFRAARWKGPDALLNQRVCKVTLTSDGYEERLLDYALPGYLNAIHRHTSSVTVKHLSSKSVANIPLPFPDVPEQRRIVAKIEELFSGLDAGIADLKKTQKQLQRYRQSVLQAAVEGRLTEDWREEHDTEPADKLLERILEERQAQWEKDYRAKYEAKGKKPPSGWKSRYKPPQEPDTSDLPELPEGWMWAGPHALYTWSNGNGLPKKNRKGGPYPVYGGNGVAGKHSEYMVEDSALIVGRVGANCGNVHIAPAESWVTDNAIYSNWKSDLVEHQFLLYQLRNKRLNRLAGGTGQPYISQKLLKSLPVALPPLEEQRQIVNEVERLLSVADEAKQTVEREIKRAERLRQSILKQAFSGKLVEQSEHAATREEAGPPVVSTEGEQIEMPL